MILTVIAQNGDTYPQMMTEPKRKDGVTQIA